MYTLITSYPTLTVVVRIWIVRVRRGIVESSQGFGRREVCSIEALVSSNMDQSTECLAIYQPSGFTSMFLLATIFHLGEITHNPRASFSFWNCSCSFELPFSIVLLASLVEELWPAEAVVLGFLRRLDMGAACADEAFVETFAAAELTPVEYMWA